MRAVSDTNLTTRDLYRYKTKRKRQREVRRKIAFLIITASLVIGSTCFLRVMTSYAITDTEDIDFKYYTSIIVKSGDSLWNIASEYIDEKHYDNIEDYISEVNSINHMHGDEIIAGQYLILPYYSSEFIQ